jgi:hypothetical protein
MDGREGVGIAGVHLDPRKKTGAERVCKIAELTIGGRQERRRWWMSTSGRGLRMMGMV